MQAFSGKLHLSETNLQKHQHNQHEQITKVGKRSFLIERSSIHPHVGWISFATFPSTQAVGVAACVEG
jgi:hypothetical protein